MICVNAYEEKKEVSRDDFDLFLKILAPFAPFITEEFWKNAGNASSIHESPWPVPSEDLMQETTVTYAVQIGGKLRATIVCATDATEEEVMNAVKSLEIYEKYIGTSTIKKVIFVQNRLINILASV
jgi:leucyl-tRNA synthetase